MTSCRGGSGVSDSLRHRRYTSWRSLGDRPDRFSWRATQPFIGCMAWGASHLLRWPWTCTRLSPNAPKNTKSPVFPGLSSTATGIRTRVSAMRGRRPSPLDDSGAWSVGAEASKAIAASRFSAICTGPIWRAAPVPSGTALVADRPVLDRCDIFAFSRHAAVAELVDAHGSGPCLGNQVEVRVLSAASVLSPPGR